MQIRISRSAEADLLDGYAFYEYQQPGIGDYFLDSLFADIDALTLFSGIHPKPDGRLHRMLAKQFPFAIYYEVRVAQRHGGRRVLDCRQNPASIADRLTRSS